MQPSGVITITTDFGHRGTFTGVMKGVILGRFPEARIIDLTHEIPPQWPPEAGFWVSHSYRHFPSGTVHVAIVDPGVGTDRDILIIEHDQHYFMAPDNGLLAELLDRPAAGAVFRLDLAALPRLNIPPPGKTFHGRDIFAPVAAELAAGRTTPVAIGQPAHEWAPAWIDPPQANQGSVSGVVVAVDSFGNLISNIEKELIESFDHPAARIAGREIPMFETYGRRQPGEFLALINSLGVVEIARAEGDASDGLGVSRGAPITVINRA